MAKENKVRKVVVMSAIICALVLVGILGSYAFFISSGTNNPENISTNTGTLALTFSDGNPGITKALEFGGSVEKIFTIENTGTLEAFAKINFEDLVNTYIESSLSYTLSYSETEDGTYTEVVTNENVPASESASTIELANGLRVPAGTKYYYKLTITLNYLEDIDQTEDLKAMLSTHFSIEEGQDTKGSADKTLGHLNLKVAENNTVNFASAATTDETANGLYSLEDDYGTSYYYRGSVENNYVKFGDYFWRIIRINGDGSLRMIYDGTQAYANGTSNAARFAWKSQAFNTNYNDAKYVGYMYGPAGTASSTSKEQAQTNTESSTIKTKLEEWYVNNIKSKGLDQYVADSIFCNDRSTPGSDATGWSDDTGKGFGTNYTAYGASSRVGIWKTDETKPSFVCPQKNDAFTVSDVEKGNGSLDEKVGLITADEIVAGGSGKYGTDNSSYYLYKGFVYWSLSPSYYDNIADVFDVAGSGYLDSYSIGTINAVAPVISLSPAYVKTLVGDGTMNNPYRDENEI